MLSSAAPVRAPTAAARGAAAAAAPRAAAPAGRRAALSALLGVPVLMIAGPGARDGASLGGGGGRRRRGSAEARAAGCGGD
jgi:hypothetical protein